MADSANLAVYMIALSRSMASREKLDEAMQRAVERSQPLERVLVEGGVLSPQQVIEVRGQRAHMGRRCKPCGKVTYLLPDEEDPRCEHCEEPLPEPKKKVKKRPAPRKRVRPRRPPPDEEVSSASSGARTRRTARLVIERQVEAAQNKLREELTAAVENRIAQLDLGGLREKIVRQVSEELRESLPRELTREEVLTALRLHLGGGGSGGDEDQVEELTARALSLITERVETADLSGLYQRVADGAAALLDREPGEPSGELQERVQDLEQRAGTMGELGLRLEALESRAEDGGVAEASAGMDPQVAEELTQRLAALEESLAGASPESDPVLAERILELEEAVAEGPGPDLGLAGRVADLESSATQSILAERVSALENAVSASPGSDPILTERVHELEQALSELAGGSAVASEGADPVSDPILTERVHELEQALSELAGGSAVASEGADPVSDPILTERVHELEQALSELAARPAPEAAFGGSDPGLLERIQGLETAFGDRITAIEVGRAVSSGGGGDAGLADRLTELELVLAADSALDTRVDELEGQLGALAQVEGRLHALEALKAPEMEEQAIKRASAEVLREVRVDLGKTSEQIVAQTIPLLEQRVHELDFSAAVERVSSEASAVVTEQVLQRTQAQLDQAADKLRMPVIEAIETRIAALDLKTLPQRVAAEASESLGLGQLADMGPRLVALEDRLNMIEQRQVIAEAGGVITDQLRVRIERLESNEAFEEVAALRFQLAEVRDSVAAAIRRAESVEGQLSGHDLPALVDRVWAMESKSAEVAALAVRLGESSDSVPSSEVAALAQRVAQLETSPAPTIDVEALAERLAALEEPAQAPAQAPADLQQEVEAAMRGASGELQLHIQALGDRLAQLEGAQPVAAGGGAPDPALVARLAALEQSAQGVRDKLQVVDARLGQIDEDQEVDGFSEAELIMANVIATVDERLGAQGEQAAAEGLSKEQVEDIVRSSIQSSSLLAGAAPPTGGSGGKTAMYDKRFMQLANKVKDLADQLNSIGAPSTSAVVTNPVSRAVQGSFNQTDIDLILSSPDFRRMVDEKITTATSLGRASGGASVGGGGGGGDLVTLLNSTEFKQLFDQKINQVLSYVKSDVVPRAVRKALEGQ